MDAAFMRYLSQIYNCLKQLYLFMTACLVNEDEHIRFAKKFYSYDARRVQVSLKTEKEEELFYD